MAGATGHGRSGSSGACVNDWIRLTARNSSVPHGGPSLKPSIWTSRRICSTSLGPCAPRKFEGKHALAGDDEGGAFRP